MIYIERQKRLRTNSKQKSTSRLHGRKHNDKLDYVPAFSVAKDLKREHG